MKTPLWTLLLLGLCVPGHSDCQKDCLFCGQILPKDLTFNTLVCLVECGKASPGLNWEMCRTAMEEGPQASLSVGGTMLKRAEEEVESVLPLEQSDGGLVYSNALQRFDHVARAMGLDQLGRESQSTQYSASYQSQQSQQSQSAEGDGEDEEDGGREMENDQDGAPVNLTKRFGGFLKSKYGYRKFMDPGRSLQKRYGGFIGVRKSARKWNNQKRFSEFLKQYLGMTTRASEFNSVSTGIAQQNEV
ncbi:prepronociceptin [Astyanax mexicanus]|uniref:Prepronociceptin-like n=2 Tax=Astyanax mexicanus TaxID=7994 RepID=A0A3B1K5F5_ASTMX|nr:prepronociceptin [Astyanax mexicanus]XP_022528221.1 prepronociceptin [Astyanax mexicanus]KAG9268886.1 prepronociceptin-like [Astyanax mexicanus]